MQNLPKEVLVIDDDSTVGQSVLGPISAYKINIVNTQDLNTALYQFDHQDYDVVMIETEYEPMNGLVLVQKFRDHDDPAKRATGFILMSGKTRKLSDDNLLKELHDLDVIVKPFSVIHLLPYLSRALAFKKKQLVFEQFRQEMRFKVKNQEGAAAIEEVKKRINQFGQKGIILLCEIYETTGGVEEALNFITPFTQKEPTNATYSYTRGRLLMLLKKYAEAKPILEKAHELAPNHLGRMNDLGSLYIGLNEPDKAVQVMKKQLSFYPETPDRKFEMFNQLDDGGHAPQAQAFCRETTKPSDVVRYYNNKGVEMSRNGDLQGAIREYQRALKFFPESKDNYRIYYNIGLALLKLKTAENDQLALENIEKCLELSPTFEKGRTTLETIIKKLSKKAS